MSAATGSIMNYPDRGDNCLVCDSTLEPDKFVCTFCELSLFEPGGPWI